MTLLSVRNSAKQCWHADDAIGAGSLENIRKWWDELLTAGPALGYYPNAKKCWFVVKPEKLDDAKDVFAGTGISITTEGRKHLGAALGQRSYQEDYVGSKVKEWINEVTALAEFSCNFSTTSQLCSFYVRAKTQVDLLHEDPTGY